MTEPINVVLLTYGNGDARTEYAIRTAQALVANIVYPELAFYIADDGSNQAHIDAVLKCFEGHPVSGWHTIPNGTYGANVNKAYQATKDYGRLTMYIEDDWVLRDRLDLYSYAAMLMEREDVGMVRLGYLNLNMRGTVFGHKDRLYWRLYRDADSYVFTGHPSLRHSRFTEAVGMYPEGLNPGYTELTYGLQYRNSQSPDIVWPVGDREMWGPFDHVGEVQSYGR
jgi:hypothetical protein